MILELVRPLPKCPRRQASIFAVNKSFVTKPQLTRLQHCEYNLFGPLTMENKAISFSLSSNGQGYNNISRVLLCFLQIQERMRAVRRSPVQQVFHTPTWFHYFTSDFKIRKSTKDRNTKQTPKFIKIYCWTRPSRSSHYKNKPLEAEK